MSGRLDRNQFKNPCLTDDSSYKTDLNLVHFGADPSSSLSIGSYSVTIKQNRTSIVEAPDTITFLHAPDLFSFQEFVTGYKVVDNLLVTLCRLARSKLTWSNK